MSHVGAAMSMLVTFNPHSSIFRAGHWLSAFLLMLGTLVSAQGWADTASDQASRALLQMFASETDPRGIEKLAMMISDNYSARKLLKTPQYKALGQKYFEAWLGNGNMAQRMLAKAKSRMGHYPKDVLDRVQLISNEASRLAKSPPMDFDVGALTRNREEARILLDHLGGPSGVDRFHKDLQRALEEAYLEMAQEIGGGGLYVDPKRAFLAATTAWHPEAYGDPKVLLKHGVPSEALIQQTADVTKYKAWELRDAVERGLVNIDDAMEEVARGTLKDVDKVSRVFDRMEQLLGRKLAFPDEAAQIIAIYNDLNRMHISPAQADEAIRAVTGGKYNIWTSAEYIADQMESVWRLRPKRPNEALLYLFAEFLDDADYDKAFRAIVDGKISEFPDSARKLIDELDAFARVRLSQLEPSTIRGTLERIKKDKLANVDGLLKNPNSEALEKLLHRLEMGDFEHDDVVKLFGPKRANELAEIRAKLTPAVKAKVAAKFRQGKFLIWEVDRETGRMLLGNADSTLGVDAGMGAIMGLIQTASIMDQGLTPEEESRQLLNAWGTALPIVGDVAQGLIEGIEWAYDDNAPTSKLFKSGAWLSIGAAGLVPGAQAYALVAGLTLMAYELGSSYFDVSEDKALIEAWLASGDWNKDQGTLKGVFDLKNDPHKLSIDGLLKDGDIGYQAGLAGVTIRDSLYQFAERGGLNRLEALQSYLRALKQLYPDFSFDATLREPLTIGKPLFGARMREAGNQSPMRSLDMNMFVAAKKIYDRETAKAAQRLIKMVEAEYQARHHTGEAYKTFRELEALGQRLGLPLLQRVKDIFKSFSAFVVEGIKTPWVRESLPRREVALAERYLAGYLEIEQSLQRIQAIFAQAGIRPPKHNLSGYLEIDAPRMKDLETAYANQAIGEPARAVQTLHREITGDTGYVFKPAAPHPCDAALFKTLSGIMVRIVDAEDRRLLLAQWSGKRSAAETSRDEKLRAAQQATEDMKKSVEIWIPGYSNYFGPWKSSVGALPGQLWDGLASSYEEAYAWTQVKWEGSEVYGSQAEAVAERIQRLREEYRKTLEDGEKAMRDCLRKQLTCAITLSNATPIKGSQINAKANVTPAAPPPGSAWQWQGSGGVSVMSSSADSAVLSVQDKGSVSLALLDSKQVKLATCQAGVDPKEPEKTDTTPPAAPKISATTPGNWEMQPIKDGVKFVRKEAKMKGPCGWDSGATASVSVTVKPGAADDKTLQAKRAEARAALDKRHKERGIGCASPDMAVGLFKAGGIDGVSAVALGELQGALADHPNWVRRGSGSPWSGYTGSSMVACGYGSALGKTGGLEYSYSSNAGGCWDNSDRAYLVRQVLAGQNEARAIIASLRLDGAGIKQTPYKGPKYDGSDNPRVVLMPDKLEKLKVGDIVSIEAVVENAEPEDAPYAYNWDGTFHGKAEDHKKLARVQLNPERPGKYKVGVGVDGQRYGMGYASLEYEVADVKVRVERVPNENKPIPVGGTAEFRAILTIDGKPGDGDYIYRWEPSTELEFSATESPAAMTTRARFTKLGRQKIWVAVLQDKGGRLATVVDSERLEVDVVQPRFTLSAEPKEPLVGQETRVTLKDEPRLDDKVAGFRWEHTGDAISPGRERDERVFSFKPKNAKPVKVIAQGYLRDGNVDLGQAEITLQPKAYEIKIGEPRYLGSKPLIWVCDGQLGTGQNCGMREVKDSQFAVFHDIFMKAQVTPAPPNPRYEWRVDPSGSCGWPGIGAELKLNCSSTGAYEVTLKVRDGDGAELGEAKATLNVSIGDDQLRQAGKSKEAEDKMRLAKQKLADGDLDAAIDLATQAAGLDPKHPEAAKMRDRWRAEQGQVMNHLNAFRQALNRGDPDAADKALDPARRLHPRYAPVVDAEKQLDAARKTRQAKQERARQLADGIANQIRAGQFDSALQGLGELKGLDAARAGALAKDLAKAAKQAAAAAEQKRDFEQSGRLFGNAAQADPADAEAARGAANAASYAARLREVRAAQAEVGAALDRNDFDTSGKRLADIRAWEGKIPGPADKVTGELQVRHDRESAAYRKTMGDLRERAEKALTAGKCDDARRLLAEVSSKRPAEPERQWAEAMNGRLARCASAAPPPPTFPGGGTGASGTGGKTSAPPPTFPGAPPPAWTTPGGATAGGTTPTTPVGGLPATRYPVGQLDPHWVPLSAVGGDFKRFARFEGGGLVVDVPAKNHWGKTGIMARQPMFKLSRKPARVTVQLDPRRTTGVCVAFAASQHPDVALIDNAWMSWVRTENDGMGDFWIGNVQDAWAGRSKGVLTRTGGQVPATLTYTLAPGTFTLTPAGGATQTAAIGWLKEGVGIYPHLFSCPAKSGDASKFALTGFTIEAETSQAGSPPPGGGRDYTGADGQVGQPVDGVPVGTARGMVRIEACVDGSDWLRIENGRLVHEHRAFNQIGAHPGCPASHAVAGGGLLVDGRKVGLAQLPLAIGLPGLGRYEVEQARGATRLDGARGLLLDDDGHGGPAIYIVRLYPGTAATGIASGGKPSVSFDNGNIGGVDNGPRQPTTFTLNEPRILVLIQNYHWNSARGQTPGSIGVVNGQGQHFGPWAASGSPGQGGVPNAYWTARPMVLLPAGTYTVIDSHPASWSHNAQSGYRGFTRVETQAPGVDDTGGRDYTGAPIQADPVGSIGRSPATPKVIFEIGNVGGVDNGPRQPSIFTLNAPSTIAMIQTYHWNSARGMSPGTIALTNAQGQRFGPWQASGSPGQGGVPNAYWTARPMVSLPAGTYTVVDSHPASWAHNAQSGYRGFVRIEGLPATGAGAGAPPAQSGGSGMERKLDDALRALDVLKDLFK